jgi:hypothetical protein
VASSKIKTVRMDALAREIGHPLVGTPVGTAAPDPDGPVAWVDPGSEVVIDPYSERARVKAGAGGAGAVQAATHTARKATQGTIPSPLPATPPPLPPTAGPRPRP